MIKIDFCQKKEIFKVQEFINDHWKKGHILAQNDILFKWLYKNKDGYNFLKLRACTLLFFIRCLYINEECSDIPPLYGGKTDRKEILNYYSSLDIIFIFRFDLEDDFLTIISPIKPIEKN